MTVLLFGSYPAFCTSPEKVFFKTQDGQILKALYVKPKHGPVVIMLHGLASGKEEWMPLVEACEKKGWGVLAYDARGHGESSTSRDQSGSPDGYKYFGRPGPGSIWEKMIDDVGSAIRFLRVDQRLKNSPIVLCGASVGANVSLNYASLTKNTKGLILLSPGLSYIEIKSSVPIMRIKNCPTLIVTSTADSYAFESSKELKKLKPSVVFWSDVKAGHGVQMFDEKLISRLVQWIENLPA